MIAFRFARAVGLMALSVAAVGCGGKSDPSGAGPTETDALKPAETGVRLVETYDVRTPPRQAVFAPDNKAVAMAVEVPDLTGTLRPIIEILDVTSKSESGLSEFPNPNNALAIECFSPDGSLLVVQKEDELQFRRVKDGQIDKTFADKKLSAYHGHASAFSPDGKRFALADHLSDDNPPRRLFLLDNSDKSLTKLGQTAEKGAPIESLRFSRDGQQLFSLDDTGLHTTYNLPSLDVATFRYLIEGPIGHRKISLSADGTTLAWLEGEKVMVSDLEGKNRAAAGGVKTLRLVGLSADGKTIVTIDEVTTKAPANWKEVKEWKNTKDFKGDVPERTNLHLNYRDASTGAVTAFIVLPDTGLGGRMTAIGPDGRRVLIWKAEKEKANVVRLYERTNEVTPK